MNVGRHGIARGVLLIRRDAKKVEEIDLLQREKANLFVLRRGWTEVGRRQIAAIASVQFLLSPRPPRRWLPESLLELPAEIAS